MSGPWDKYAQQQPSDYDYEAARAAGVQQGANGHWPDTYKLPNHITFSTDSKYSKPGQEGGTWSQVNGKWHYKPSAFVLSQHPAEELQSYFSKSEQGSVLDLPQAAGPWAKYSQPSTAPEPDVAVRGDYRDKYAGQSLAQGNVGYLLDYIKGIGKAATKERPADFSTTGGPAGSLVGAGDAALNLGTSALAPLFALPDYALTKLGIPDKRNPSGTYAGAKSKYVYQPRTSMGQGASELAGAALKPVGDVFSLIGSGYGDIAGQLGTSPQVQNEIRDIAPDVVSAALTIGQLRSMNKAPAQQPIPSTEELRQAKQQAYKAGSASTVLTSPEQNAAAMAKIDAALKSENIIVDPDLHPKSSALMRRLTAQKDKPLTVPEAESLRQLALEVQRDIDPVTKQPTADAFRAGVILDELDNSLETLSVNQGARALNARFRRSQLVDEMIHRAEIKAGANYTQAGMEHALRNEFKQLALNPRRMRGLNEAQRAAIEKVAKGGPIENSLRVLGKFDPTTGGMAAFIGTGTGSMVGSALGGLAGGGVGALAVPALGFLGKRGATAMTAKNVAAARQALVGSEPLPLSPTIPESAAIPSLPPLLLPAPNIIAGSRTAPGTAYAREQMGLTPDIEHAGALHPGVARQSQPAPPLALPYRPTQERPIVVDQQGRAAPTPEEIQTYLKDMGLDRLRNVRQPIAEPPKQPQLAPPLALQLRKRPTRSVAQIRQDLEQLDASLRALPANEQLASPKTQMLRAEWKRLQAELAAAESAAASQ